MIQQLKKLAYVRKGSGSTAGTVTVTVKDRNGGTIEAVALLLSALSSSVRTISYGVFVVTDMEIK